MQLFRLALARGCSVRELLETTDSYELSEWLSFLKEEPVGYHMDNWRMGQLASTIVNFSGRAKKAATAADFMPDRRKELSPEGYLAILNAKFGGAGESERN